MRQHQLRQQSFDTSNMEKKKNDRLQCVCSVARTLVRFHCRSLPQVRSYNVFNFRPQLKIKKSLIDVRFEETKRDVQCLLVSSPTKQNRQHKWNEEKDFPFHAMCRVYISRHFSHSIDDRFGRSRSHSYTRALFCFRANNWNKQSSKCVLYRYRYVHGLLFRVFCYSFFSQLNSYALPFLIHWLNLNEIVKCVWCVDPSDLSL